MCDKTCMQDFLETDPTDISFAKVRAVLLDPSCSGSGMAATRSFHLKNNQAKCHSQVADAGGSEAARTASNALDASGATSCASSRVQSLAAFQTRILRHALAFPAVQRLAYSTCSVYRQENEDVIAAVLPHAQQLGFELATALPQWHRRGLQGSYGWADKVVRVDPELDETDGFFVAVFVRSIEST